jgi:cation:H+ antiporter
MEHPAIAVGVLVISIALLWFGADWMVLSAARMARHLGLTDLTVGLTIVALGTSTPEFLVTLFAAFQDQPAISLGNIVGSNIFNTGLILGICALVWRIETPPLLVYRDLPLLIAAAGCVLLFSNDGQLGRGEGVVMVGVLAGYLTYVIFARSSATIEIEELPTGSSQFQDLPRLLLGVGCVMGGAHLLVSSAVSLAHTFEIEPWLIAVTAVAGGTSLPEFATSLAAARRGHTQMVFGNLVGSDLFNLLGVLGLALVIRPIDVGPSGQLGLAMMVGMLLLLFISVLRGRTMSRAAGLLLIAAALARWSVDLLPG